MKSNKQRRVEIKARRRQRAAVPATHSFKPDVRLPRVGAYASDDEPADRSVLLRYNNTYGPLPTFYAAQPFVCCDCGAQEVWTAKQQKWWYETVHGHIESRAVRCLACRRARRERVRSAGPGANLLGEQTNRLRALGETKPTEKALAEVDAALQSKWWSLRVVAIQTMVRWGDADRIEKLKAMIAARPEGGRRYWSWERVAADAAMCALIRRE
ncbi:zinc-ribbon domain containing protein [Variovorax sp. PAMC26660]|uniref:zinc-ribbon domain containing protein n=1 Tax=Variovorax sp. PAMC26660 TaxID=2762322 RepID=UPI00164E59E5|nr:zinc-ribbon domain containing protein [Variovorax sp. PAMC26660]QNK69411.1 zinc-ribbon domain containing protein [Variovorax sp. PAMC26660]